MNTTQTPRPVSAPLPDQARATFPGRTTPPSPPLPPPPSPDPADPERLSRVLPALLDPTYSALRLCDVFGFTIHDLAAALTSDRLADAIAAFREIARLRLELIQIEAEVAAWSRLTELASDHPTTATGRETSRKAAAQILRLRTPPAAGGHQPPDGPQADTPDPGAGGFQPPDRPQADAPGRAGFQPAHRPEADAHQTPNPPPPRNPFADAPGQSNTPSLTLRPRPTE